MYDVKNEKSPDPSPPLGAISLNNQVKIWLSINQVLFNR